MADKTIDVLLRIEALLTLLVERKRGRDANMELFREQATALYEHRQALERKVRSFMAPLAETQEERKAINGLVRSVGDAVVPHAYHGEPLPEGRMAEISGVVAAFRPDRFDYWSVHHSARESVALASILKRLKRGGKAKA